LFVERVRHLLRTGEPKGGFRTDLFDFKRRFGRRIDVDLLLLLLFV
jgi:hypothetical protein